MITYLPGIEYIRVYVGERGIIWLVWNNTSIPGNDPKSAACVKRHKGIYQKTNGMVVFATFQSDIRPVLSIFQPRQLPMDKSIQLETFLWFNKHITI